MVEHRRAVALGEVKSVVQKAQVSELQNRKNSLLCVKSSSLARLSRLGFFLLQSRKTVSGSPPA